MKGNFITSKKYIVIALFLVAAVLSVLLVSRVGINYNISDYLEEDTETKISLSIIEDEFGLTGDVQIVIEDISVEDAKHVRDTLKNIENVLTVNFNEYDEGYYKDGNALFVALVDGDEYSEVANVVVEDIKVALNEIYGEQIHYGGAIVEKANLRHAIEGEIPFVLGISLCLVVAIMLLTSKSWIEPIILLAASGVAILINMGTNVIFGEISYITNAVAAILQLALSIDYSIVLLHGYRKIKETEPDKNKAMAGAIKEVMKPISASALTTIAGLLALLFMSMRIGFDIGIVLMKGIVVSAIVSLTLLPALLLLCDAPLNKTKKRDLVLRGKVFCRMAFKACKVVVPLTLVLIMVCGVLQFGNAYAFTDSQKSNTGIADFFGRNNTVVVVYPNGEDNYAKENALAQKLGAYKTADGKYVLKSYTAYSNTVRELYDVELAARKLNLPVSDVEMLFTMYHLYGDHALIKVTPEDFVTYADQLMTEDADAQSFSNEEMTKMLRTLLAIDEMMDGAFTAEEFHALISSGVMGESTLSLFALKQMYGLYAYDKIEEKEVPLKALINFAASAAADGALGDMIDATVAESLSSLALGMEQFEEQMNKPMTKAEFQAYMLDEQGVALDASQVAILYAAYFAEENGVIGETIPLIDLLTYLVASGQITDADAVAGVAQLNELFANGTEAFRADMDKKMTQAEFQDCMSNKFGVTLSDMEVMFLFIGYFSDNALPMQDRIPFLSLLNYLVEAGYVTDSDSCESIEKLNQLYNMDPYVPMTKAEFKTYMLEEQGVTLEDDQLKLLYAAYFAQERDVVGETIPFLSLMNYLVSMEQIDDADAVATIEGCNALMQALPGSYAYDEILALLEDTVATLTGETIELGFDDSAIQQIYIMYFYEQGTVPTESIVGRDFVYFVIETADTNATIGAQLSDDTMLKLGDLLAVDAFMSDTTAYDFVGMTERIKALQGEIKSLSSSGELKDSIVSGVYIKYAVSNGQALVGAIEAQDLLAFVSDNMETQELLKAKISSENRAKVEDAKSSVEKATDLFVGEKHSRMLLSINLQSESEESSAFVVYLLNSVKEIFGDGAHIAGEMVSTYDLQEAFDEDNTLITIFTIISIFIIVMIVFRSLSLPVVLVAVIQGAIWIAMSTSLLTGPMFFMSYIVATCILMGATIDYGILMSTNYVQNRLVYDKKESLYKAVEAAMPTVFTSGMILTICGLIIGFISSQNAIATVGILIGKGTLVSVLMITLVLPSILYLLDGFILKLSKTKKNVNK